MTTLAKRQIGKTTAHVTQFGLGCAPLGDLFEAISEEQAQQIKRSIITSGTTASSGGIKTADLSRDTGGAAMSSHETTKVNSTIARNIKKRSVSSQSASLGGRSDESIRRAMDKNKGAAPPSHDVRALVPTYDDLGIGYMQAHRWQVESSLPEEHFIQISNCTLKSLVKVDTREMFIIMCNE